MKPGDLKSFTAAGLEQFTRALREGIRRAKASLTTKEHRP